jgi:hypothetical protein
MRPRLHNKPLLTGGPGSLASLGNPARGRAAVVSRINKKSHDHERCTMKEAILRDESLSWWLGTVVVTALCACGGSVEITPDSIPESEFAGAYAVAHCSFSECCGNGGLVPDPGCRAKSESEARARLDAARAAGASFDAVAASACVDEIRTVAAACPTFKSGVLFASKCEAVFRDKPKPAGAPCLTDWECADQPATTGMCITNVSAAGYGQRCGPVVVSDENEQCGAFLDGWRNCREPFACFPDEICRRRAGAGESCPTGAATGDLCVDGYVCDRLASKQCVAAKHAGESCSASEECEFFDCKKGRCGWSGNTMFPDACRNP